MAADHGIARRVSTNRVVTLALVLALVGGVRLVKAAELTASGPRECADAVEISFRVERAIGMSLAHAAPLAFEVVMERAAAGHVAHIEVTGAAPEATRFTRELSATDCDELVDAVSVAIALALGAAEPSPDADAAASTERANAADARSAAAAASAAPASGTAPAHAAADAGDDESQETARPSVAPSLSLWLLGDAGSLPSPSLGAALGAELGWSKLELRALGTVLFERETQVESSSSPAPGAKLQLVTGGLLACAAPFGSLRATLAPFACFGAEIGRLSGVGTGVASPRRGGALWVAPLVQVGAAWTVPETALGLAMGVVVAAPLARDEFALRDIGTVHQPPSVVGRLSVGVSVRFD
jgi:hypothetical protein